jgi:hypothetical protein
MVLAVECPRPFSFRPRVFLAAARPLQVHRPLAAPRADHRHLVLFLWRCVLLADRPHQPLTARPAVVAWSALAHSPFHRPDALVLDSPGRALSLQAGLYPSLLGQRQVLLVEYASTTGMLALQREAFAQRRERLPHEEPHLAVAWVSLFQTFCLARRALARLCPQEMYLVGPEACPLVVAWRVALPAPLGQATLYPQETCLACLEVCLSEATSRAAR